MRAFLALTVCACVSACGAPVDEPALSLDPALAVSGDPHQSAIEAVTPVDYADPAAWLCRPGAEDACEADLSTTVIAADGTMKAEAFKADPDAAIDCFYVYPTVSLDETPNSDTLAGPEELNVVQQQFARFGAACRLYAPLYRQVTLPALRAMMQGETPATNREMAYADVKAAWDHYLANDNAGRGVVLIGHSQGSGVLTRLIANEIDGKPVQDHLVSALLLGTNLAVPPDGSGIGGSFREIGLCVSSEDLGCAIAYASFRADEPPAEGALFGKAAEQGMNAACLNPADLDGSAGALKAYLPAGQATASSAAPGPWTTPEKPVETPFVAVPGLLSAQCVTKNGFTYLAITTNADPQDARTDTITGDVMTAERIQPGWGLHLIDANLAMGNLVVIVQAQAKSYASREISRTQHPQDEQ